MDTDLYFISTIIWPSPILTPLPIGLTSGLWKAPKHVISKLTASFCLKKVPYYTLCLLQDNWSVVLMQFFSWEFCKFDFKLIYCIKGINHAKNIQWHTKLVVCLQKKATVILRPIDTWSPLAKCATLIDFCRVRKWE